MPSFPELLEKLVTAVTAFRIWRDWGLKKVLRPNATGQRKKRKVGSEKPALCLRIVQAWLRFGYRTWDCVVETILVPITPPDTIDASILLTAFRGTI